MSDFFSSDGIGLEVVASAVVVIAAVVVRVLGGRYVRRKTRGADDEGREGRAWIVRLRNATVLFVFVALIAIWADELRTAALTFVAAAVALVIATKELIMSVSGSVVRTTSGSFAIGDRIRVGDTRGIVIDHSMLSTTLLEIGPTHVRTGRTVTLPNSVFLSTPVANEGRGDHYVLHSFTVPVSRAQWERASVVLQQAAVEASSSYIDDARKHMQRRAARFALPVPTVDPFVLSNATGVDVVELTVRLPVPSRDVWHIENEVLRAWLEKPADGEGPREPSSASG